MIVLIGVAVLGVTMVQQTPDRSILESLSFLVGEWDAVFDAPAAGGQRMTSVVHTRWGLERAWLLSDVEADASSSPRYGVHIVVAADVLRRRPVAFAVNTLSPVPIAYDGQQPEPRHVVFTGSAAGKWQSVSYRLIDRDHLDFLVEEATTPDGPWTRHSHAILTRRSEAPRGRTGSGEGPGTRH